MSKTLNIASVRLLKPFLALNAHQQQFIEAMVDSTSAEYPQGNKIASVKIAYNPGNDNAAAVAAWKLMRNPKILQVLDLIKNDRPLQPFTYEIAAESPRYADSRTVADGPSSEYDEVSRGVLAARIERPGLKSLARLLEITQYCHGGAGEFISTDEYRSEKYGTVNMMQLVENRIGELGLNRDRVWQFPFMRGYFPDWQAEKSFFRMPFEKRMARFI